MSALRLTLERVGPCRFVGSDEDGGASIYSGSAALADDIAARTSDPALIPKRGISAESLSQGLRPMHALLGSLAACGALDTVVILLKQREPVGRFFVHVVGERPDTTPAPFRSVTLKIDAPGVDPEKRPEPPVILLHKCQIVADMRPKIQRIQRRLAHPARTGSLKRHKSGNAGEDGWIKRLDS